jgi:hypothetical protein
MNPIDVKSNIFSGIITNESMDSTDALALAALVVALVALLNTVSQVLQQYFATADGYRRCSPSVMGDWARFTRRKFKWRELRFETVREDHTSSRIPHSLYAGTKLE